MYLNAEYINSDDIIERIVELEEESDEHGALSPEDFEELQKLRAIEEECKQYNSDWEYDALLIAESSFVDYVKDMLTDCGDIPKDIPQYVAIDWEQTAENIKVNYVPIQIEGSTYYIRQT